MKLVIQTDSLHWLKEAVKSSCQGIRFGSEFCEFKIPSLDDLQVAYSIVRRERKEFTYITPRLSNSGVIKVRKQFLFLNEAGDVSVVFNDFGALRMLRECKNVFKRLGRQLVRVPARSPWAEIIVEEGLRFGGMKWPMWETGDFFTRWYNKIFSCTSINYPLTIEFLKSRGVLGMDMDWIPRIFPSLRLLTGQGLRVSVYLYLVPLAVTRKCHTARFMGEESPEKCSKPCLNNAFGLKNESIFVAMFLHGNAIFSFVEPSLKDVKRLKENNIDEIVLTMNTIMSPKTSSEIDNLFLSLNALDKT